MPRPELYIISDLHLCDGSRVEDFLPADERGLVAFLFRLSRSPAATLIINGDFIDFAQIQPRPHMWFDTRLDASEAESLEKLEATFAAHSPVFDALGRFVAAGHALLFHIGNHDIDLIWPRVQARLRERLGKKPVHAQITFGESYADGGLYVEHGHQADPSNRFPTQPDITHPDLLGVMRLERCWGTRLVEEFYNRIEVLDGCDLLDNVRPRMHAAVLIIKYAILHRQMHATLYAGLKVILETLTKLQTEQDVANAAMQLGVNQQVLGWIVSVAGWLGVGAQTEHVAKSAGDRPLLVPSLQTAYAYGTALRDGSQLVRLAPSTPIEPALAEKSGNIGVNGTARNTARRAFTAADNQRLLHYAADIARRHPDDIRAVCFGHTHQAITTALLVDGMTGWPLPNTAARYFNSGSWTRTLDLRDVDPTIATYEYLIQPEHYRVGRDYLKVTWPDDPRKPQVEILTSQ